MVEESYEGTSQTRTSPWAIWALVLGILGLCCFPVGLVGAVLGIVGLVKMEKDRALTGKGMAIAGLAIGASSIVINGMLAALAVPAFMGYTRRAKTTEVTTHFSTIYSGIESRYRAQASVDSIPLTPADVPCAEKHVWTAEERAPFMAIGFDPGASLFSYEVVVSAPGQEHFAVIRARGDLDCDDQTSLFELAIDKDANGELHRAQSIHIENEVE